MTFEDILNKIALDENTTKHQVECDMQYALELAGIDIEAEKFVCLVLGKLKDYIL